MNYMENIEVNTRLNLYIPKSNESQNSYFNKKIALLMFIVFLEKTYRYNHTN